MSDDEQQSKSAEVERYAARYRWIRIRDSAKPLAVCEFDEELGDWVSLGFSPDDIDAAIDAAMKEKP